MHNTGNYFPMTTNSLIYNLFVESKAASSWNMAGLFTHTSYHYIHCHNQIMSCKSDVVAVLLVHV